jgi:hypothetical protein
MTKDPLSPALPKGWRLHHAITLRLGGDPADETGSS